MRARTRVALAASAALVLALAVESTVRTKAHDRDAASREQEPLHSLRVFEELPASFVAAAEHHKAAEPPSNAPIPGYVPAGLPPDFRDRIVSDFAEHLDARLGPNALTDDQRSAIARTQREFWDEQGPNVDAFAAGRITQPELADRTRIAMKRFSDRMASVLSDAEYLALFDANKSDDLYSAMFHSADEQPGLPLNPLEDEPPSGAASTDLATRPPPPSPAPPATEARIPGDRAPVPKTKHDRESDRARAP